MKSSFASSQIVLLLLVWCVALGLIAGSNAATNDGSDKGFRCAAQKEWRTAAPADRKVWTCVEEDNYGVRGGVFVAMVLGLLPAGLITIGYLPFLIGRQLCNCFGSSRRRPDTFCCGGAEWDIRPDTVKDNAYSDKRLLKARKWVATLFIVSLCCSTFVFAGKMLAKEAYAEWKADLDFTVGNYWWGSSNASTILKQTTFPANDTFVSPFSRAVITSALQSGPLELARVYYASAEDKRVQFWFPIVLATNVAPVAVVAAFLGLITACTYDMRRTVPLVLSAIFAFLTIGCGLGTFGASYLYGTLQSSIEEAELYRDGHGGIGRDKLISHCEIAAPQSVALPQKLSDAVVSYSRDACTTFRTVCDAAAGSPTPIPFYCSNYPSYSTASSCSALSHVDALISGNTAKSGGTPCVASVATCNLFNCQTGCNASTHRASATSAYLSRNIASRLEAARAVADTSLCAAAVSRLALTLTRRSDLKRAMALLITGLLFLTYASFGGVVLSFKGQKLFFKKMKPKKTKKRILLEAMQRRASAVMGGSAINATSNAGRRASLIPAAGAQISNNAPY